MLPRLSMVSGASFMLCLVIALAGVRPLRGGSACELRTSELMKVDAKSRISYIIALRGGGKKVRDTGKEGKTRVNGGEDPNTKKKSSKREAESAPLGPVVRIQKQRMKNEPESNDEADSDVENWYAEDENNTAISSDDETSSWIRRLSSSQVREDAEEEDEDVPTYVNRTELIERIRGTQLAPDGELEAYVEEIDQQHEADEKEFWNTVGKQEKLQVGTGEGTGDDGPDDQKRPTEQQKGGSDGGKAEQRGQDAAPPQKKKRVNKKMERLAAKKRR